MVDVYVEAACFRCHDVNYTYIFDFVKDMIYFPDDTGDGYGVVRWIGCSMCADCSARYTGSEAEVEVEIQEFPYDDGQGYGEYDTPESKDRATEYENDHHDHRVQFR